MIKSSYRQNLDELLTQQGGILRTRDVDARGIPRTYMQQFVQSHGLEQVQRGVYLQQDAVADSLYLLQSTYTQSIVSHETALYFFDLTDREPLQPTITVKTGYNATKLIEHGVKVYRIKKELYALGMTTAQTPFGRTVRIYDRERTICDILRNRSRIDFQTVHTALKEYVLQADKNLPQLMRYANSLHVANILQKYLEVLL